LSTSSGPPTPFGLPSSPASQAQGAGLFGVQTIPPTRSLSPQSSTQSQPGSSLFGAANVRYGGFGLQNLESAVIAAIDIKDKDKVEELLSLVTDPKEIDRALDIVATSGDLALMKILLSSPHANVDGLSCDTPLFRASLGVMSRL
jgi:hypothetical protein